MRRDAGSQQRRSRGSAVPAGRPAPSREGDKPVRRRSAGSGRLAAAFKHHQAVAVDSLARLLREPVATTLAWAVIGIALAVPLSLFLLLQNLQRFGSGLEQAVRISVFMERKTEDSQLEAWRERLLAHPDVAAVEIITAREALEEFRETSGFEQVLEGLDENPLPPVLVVTPAAADTGAVEELLGWLAIRPEVDDAQLDMAWVQRLSAIAALAGRFSLLLGALLCAGVVLVIGNTVRLAVEARRTEITVIKLVGGTDVYVARPFLYTGLWHGAGGGIAAWMLVQLTLLSLQGPVSQLAGLYGGGFSLVGMGAAGLLLVAAGGGLLGWTGAWIAVRRQLRAIDP